MQIKATVRYYLLPVRMTIINKSTYKKCWWGGGETVTPLYFLVQPLWKAVGRYLKKSKVDLPFDPAIPLLGIYPKEPKTLIEKNISTRMFTAALFTIAKIWKQPKCPSIDEWIKQLWDIYTMENYLAIRKEENFTLCNSMDAPGKHYAEWNWPVRERQIPYEFAHMWTLKHKMI